MPDALVIAPIALAALACPVMMLLRRSGVGVGCQMPDCGPRRESPESLAQLRERKRRLRWPIEQLELSEPVRR